MPAVNEKHIRLSIIAPAFAALAVAGLTILHIAGVGGTAFDIMVFFDSHDMNVYFASSRWIIEGGHLYREVPSEYPLLANLIFASLRYLSNLVDPGIDAFHIGWMVSASVVYVYAVYRVATGTTLLATLAWVAPASIYFALFRFDVYPAVANLVSLFAIRRAAYIEGALWLGVAVALKGYALFLLPSYCVFLVYQRGVALAIKAGLLATSPMLLNLLIVLVFAGWEGVLAPFKFRALWTLNGQSTYDAINYLFGTRLTLQVQAATWVAHSLQIGCAIAAAGMRPRTFEDLIRALLFALLGFVSFSIFYSPQFLLWILPLTCFSRSRAMQMLTILFAWLTYLYFPISWGLTKSSHRQPYLLFKAVIVAVSTVRLFMMGLVIKELRGSRAHRQEGHSICA